MKTRLWQTCGTLALALGTWVGCGDLAIDRGDAVSEDAQESSDAEALEMIRQNEVAEARSWLADEKRHVLWKGDRAAIKKLVDELYAAGAPKVYAAGIEKEDDIEIVALFMAEVPADATTRQKIFDVQTNFWKSYLEDATPEDLEEVSEKDTGQKYLIFNFDL